MHRNATAFLTLFALAFLFSIAISYASPKTPTTVIKATKTKTLCTTLENKRRDCRLQLSSYDVQLSRVKITWSDGTWKNIADAPLPDENFQWDKVSFEKINDRWFLQFWIWDAGKGEAKVQSLHWIVGELKDKKFVAYVDEIVRKREVHATQPISYTYDRVVPHSLKKTKAEVQWTVGHNTGTI